MGILSLAEEESRKTLWYPVTLWVHEGREERNHSTETIIQLCESSTCTLCVWDLQHDIKAGCQKKSAHKLPVARRVRSDREDKLSTVTLAAHVRQGLMNKY